MADTQNHKSATVSEVGQGTAWLSSTYQNPIGILNFDISYSSDWDGVIEVQRRRASNTGTVRTIKQYTGGNDTGDSITDPVAGVQYRLYCSSYVAGEVELEIYNQG